jgi:hypothetical protein
MMKNFLAVSAGSILAIMAVAFLPGVFALGGAALGFVAVAAGTVTA